MRFEREDARIGLLVLIALLLFAGLAFQRTLRSLLQRETIYELRLASAPDLIGGTPVELQGYQVGRVRDVAMTRSDKTYELVARLGLRPEVVLWRGTRGVIVSPLLGSAYLDLRLPPLAERTVELHAGDRLEGEAGPSLEALISELVAAAHGIDRAVAELRQELQDHGLASVFDNPRLAAALDEARGAFSAFHHTAQTATSTFVHGDETLAVFDRDLVSLEASIIAVRELIEQRSPEIEAAFTELTAAAIHMRAVADDLQKMIGPMGPQADASLHALRRDLESAEELLELLKAKPNRLVMGTPTPAERAEARARAEAARAADQAKPATTSPDRDPASAASPPQSAAPESGSSPLPAPPPETPSPPPAPPPNASAPSGR